MYLSCEGIYSEDFKELEELVWLFDVFTVIDKTSSILPKIECTLELLQNSQNYLSPGIVVYRIILQIVNGINSAV